MLGFGETLRGTGERENNGFGNVDVRSQEAGILQRGIFVNTQTLSQLGGFTYLAGSGSHLGNVYAAMQREKCYLSASQFPAMMLGISVLPAHKEGLGHGGYVTVFGNKNGRSL